MEKGLFFNYDDDGDENKSSGEVSVVRRSLKCIVADSKAFNNFIK